MDVNQSSSKTSWLFCHRISSVYLFSICPVGATSNDPVLPQEETDSRAKLDNTLPTCDQLTGNILTRQLNGKWINPSSPDERQIHYHCAINTKPNQYNQTLQLDVHMEAHEVYIHIYKLIYMPESWRGEAMLRFNSIFLGNLKCLWIYITLEMIKEHIISFFEIALRSSDISIC